MAHHHGPRSHIAPPEPDGQNEAQTRDLRPTSAPRSGGQINKVETARQHQPVDRCKGANAEFGSHIGTANLAGKHRARVRDRGPTPTLLFRCRIRQRLATTSARTHPRANQARARDRGPTPTPPTRRANIGRERGTEVPHRHLCFGAASDSVSGPHPHEPTRGQIRRECGTEVPNRQRQPGGANIGRERGAEVPHRYLCFDATSDSV